MSSIREYNARKEGFTIDRFSDDQTRAFFKCRKFDDPELLFRCLHEKQLVGAPAFSI